jgi:hypothetical protein
MMMIIHGIIITTMIARIHHKTNTKYHKNKSIIPKKNKKHPPNLYLLSGDLTCVIGKTS